MWACRGSCSWAVRGWRGATSTPDLTAGRYTRSAGAGARLYRTGRRARWRGGRHAGVPGGRTDFQVKVRGFRIELGVGRAPPSTRMAEATVVARQGADKQLVGYAVAKPERTLDAAELKAHLRQRRCRSTWCPRRWCRWTRLPLREQQGGPRGAAGAEPRSDRGAAEVEQLPAGLQTIRCHIILGV